MSITIPQAWLYPASLKEAQAVQRKLAQNVVTEDRLAPVHIIGGADVSNPLGDPQKRVYAALVTLSYPALQVTHSTCAAQVSALAYVPGFLAFREVPALIDAFGQLPQRPDLVLVDGHGISHPRGLGIASHLGVLLDLPTIGVAKSILVGHTLEDPGPNPGDNVPLIWQDRVIGVALRTKAKTKPVYVSVGHRISLDSAIRWVMQCQKGYRLPEPTRQAHQAANQCRRLHTLGSQ